MTKGIGHTVRTALKRAQSHDRLVIGLSQAVKTLTNEPDDAFFCVLAQPKVGDSATHMQEILLEAYCFENGIYVLKVDTSEKLSRIVHAPKLESCALIQRYEIDQMEDELVDHCEAFWECQTQPIIRLPDE